MAQSKNWCFTAYNEIEQYDEINNIIQRDKKVIIKYIIYQGEICPKTGKKHIQGFIQTNNKTRMEQIKKLLNDNTVHLETMKGTPDQSRDYCYKTEKDGEKQEIFLEYQEYGEYDPTKSGTRTDIMKLKDEIDTGKHILDIQRDTEDPKIFETILRYSRPLKEYSRHIQQQRNKSKIQEKYKDYKWNTQQIYLKNIIDTELQTPDHRRINWIYDEIGGIGKTDLATYYITHQETYYITGGKQADILYAYNGQPLIIYDLARTYADNIDHIYTTIENLKNGVYLSTKYESEQRTYIRPTIYILANFKPDISKLSKDRWNIIDTDEIQDIHSETVEEPEIKPRKKRQ